jgi:hypothetical protein
MQGRETWVRPLGLGEVVDRAIALTRRRFGPLFVAMLAVEAPALALARSQGSRAGELLAAAQDPARAAALLPGLLAALSGMLVALLALQLVATAVAAAIVAPVLDPREGARPGRARRAGAILAAAALHVLALVAAPALAAAPGLALAARLDGIAARVAAVALSLAVAVVAFVVVLLRLVLAPAAAAVEGIGPAALARSARLMEPAPGARILDRPGVRASLVLLATFLLALAVNALAGLPRALAVRALAEPGPLGWLGAALPLPAEIALSLVEAVAAAAIQPFSLVAVAVLYFERRARLEGLDVELWAARLEAER